MEFWPWSFFFYTNKENLRLNQLRIQLKETKFQELNYFRLLAYLVYLRSYYTEFMRRPGNNSGVFDNFPVTGRSRSQGCSGPVGVRGRVLPRNKEEAFQSSVGTSGITPHTGYSWMTSNLSFLPSSQDFPFPKSCRSVDKNLREEGLPKGGASGEPRKARCCRDMGIGSFRKSSKHFCSQESSTHWQLDAHSGLTVPGQGVAAGKVWCRGAGGS